MNRSASKTALLEQIERERRQASLFSYSDHGLFTPVTVATADLAAEQAGLGITCARAGLPNPAVAAGLGNPAGAKLMIHTAHASCCHWLTAGTGLHHQRGEWLIARVYAVRGSRRRHCVMPIGVWS